MSNFLNRVFTGFMGGLVSALILIFVFAFVREHGVVLDDAFKYNLYRLMVWGGVWGILLAFPLSKNIFIKGTIVGLAVVFFNFIVLMPLSGKGFFASNAGVEAFVMNLVFNYLWGVLAAVIYKAADGK